MRLFVYYFSFSTYNTHILLYIKNGDYMKKRFKRKRRIKIQLIVYISMLLFLILLSYFYFKNITLLNSNKAFIDRLLLNIKNESVNSAINYINKNIFNNPVYFLKSELDYESKKEIISFAYVEVEKPKIYIYNSHQGEMYAKTYLEEYNITPNVLMASQMLSEKLNKLGIETLVEENNILEYMNKNGLDHSESYIASRHFLEKIINKYKSMELYIDLHRDSINHDASYINIDGKDCAKILFVIGLEYETYQNNLNIVEQINNIINTKYPGLSRGIMKKEGYGVNGVYNQDLSSNIILIEIGGYENNIDEVNNTLELLSIALKEYLDE